MNRMLARQWSRGAVGVALVGTVLTGAGAVVPGDTAAAAPACTLAGQVATWPVRRLAEQTVVVPVEETHVGRVADEVSAGAGGVILFGSSAPADLAGSLATLTGKAPHGIAPLVMTDEEGGAVQRMPNLVGSMPSARTMGATMTPRRIRSLAHTVGARMRHAGVTMNLAPVLDLDNGPGPDRNHPIGTRSFSLRVRTATADGLAFARGMRAAGVVPVVKHFPGLGQATGNTDVEPASTKPWSYLRKHGLRPFVSAIGAGLPAVMVSNARVPGLTRIPASLSRTAIHQELRTRLGFHGLVLTDSLSAGAISGAGFRVPAASVRALDAGADMVLFSADRRAVAARTRQVVHAIVGAVGAGHLSRARLEAAAVHVLRAKHVDLCS
jgi:beta-N-acetylhexosaminidase